MTTPPLTVLLTGATGYIGRRLKDHLLQRNDVKLRLLVRNPAKLSLSLGKQAEIIAGDTFDLSVLEQALRGVDVAYYLIHSMGAGADYAAQDRLSAENFRNACIAAGVGRIVYLGGLGARHSSSEHLLSRLETGDILSANDGKVQTLWFRAGVIIGAGSASFEIIHDLTQNLPVMVAPKWLKTKTQPIAVDDVLAYLEAAVDVAVKGNLMVDIGSDITDFRGLLTHAAASMKLKRLVITVPFFSPKLASYWLVFVTRVPFSISSALIQGLKSETVVENDNAQRYFPQIQPISLPQAFDAARQEVEHAQVLSRWCDSSDGSSCDIRRQDELSPAMLKDRREFSLSGLDHTAVFEQLCRLGGEGGWDAYDSLWDLRGLIDKALGGVGLNRGRRDPDNLRVGDAVDFWKVVDLQPNKRLLLSAQMKLPGKGWLEFLIDDDMLIQTAYFYPEGLWGKIYWWSVSPLHRLVFPRMGRKLLDKVRLG